MNVTDKYMEETARLRETPIIDVLRDLGCDTRHTIHGLFFSPFHNEKTPSFHVDAKRNLWHDFSAQDPDEHNGGDVILLVQKLRSCDFKAAKDYLRAFRPDLSADYSKELIDAPEGVTAVGSGTVTIDKITRPIYSTILRKYITGERHIPAYLVDRYCAQVNYTYTYADGNKSSRFGIGFPNIDGNWAIRMPKMRSGCGKISTGGNYSVITSDGRFAHEITSDRVVIVEGFITGLSLLAIKKIAAPKVADLVILNSVSNTKKALEWITKTGRTKSVIGYLDNDATGDRYTDYIRRQLEAAGVEFLDRRSCYAEFNDINDLLTARCQEAVLKPLDVDGVRDHQAVHRAPEDGPEGLSRTPAIEPPVWHASPKPIR